MKDKNIQCANKKHTNVPSNTTAKIVLPDGEKTVHAGEYEYTVG